MLHRRPVGARVSFHHPEPAIAFHQLAAAILAVAILALSIAATAGRRP